MRKLTIENQKIESIPELFLDQATSDLRLKRFNEAANMVLLAVTEFDHSMEITDYLTRQLKDLSPREADHFVEELVKEINWLEADVLEKRSQANRLQSFKKKLTTLGAGSQHDHFGVVNRDIDVVISIDGKKELRISPSGGPFATIAFGTESLPFNQVLSERRKAYFKIKNIRSMRRLRRQPIYAIVCSRKTRANAIVRGHRPAQKSLLMRARLRYQRCRNNIDIPSFRRKW